MKKSKLNAFFGYVCSLQSKMISQSKKYYINCLIKNCFKNQHSQIINNCHLHKSISDQSTAITLCCLQLSHGIFEKYSLIIPWGLSLPHKQNSFFKCGSNAMCYISTQFPFPISINGITKKNSSLLKSGGTYLC